MDSGPTPGELRDAVDEVAIRALIATYADVVNRRTWPEFAQLFLPDASIAIDLRDRDPFVLTGPEELGAFIGDALAQYPFFEFVALNTRVMLRRDAHPDRAAVRTYMCELRQDHDGGPSRAFGVYQDVVVRSSDGWRFERRSYQSIGRGEYGLDLMPWPAIVGDPTEA